MAEAEATADERGRDTIGALSVQLFADGQAALRCEFAGVSIINAEVPIEYLTDWLTLAGRNLQGEYSAALNQAEESTDQPTDETESATASGERV